MPIGTSTLTLTLTTIPLIKMTAYRGKARWSEWSDSTRKIVAYAFDLKGHSRILKAGIRLYGVDGIDNIWNTCCALHNLLLDKDGRLGQWDGEIVSLRLTRKQITYNLHYED